MYAYNPRKKSYQQLESSMVGGDRWDILNNILQEMDIKKGEGPKQHWMIIGPRGSGKSHLMTLLYYKVKDNRKLNRRWIPILFPEELKMTGSLHKFLERTLNEIILEFEQREKESPILDELRERINQVKKFPISERADNFFSLISWFHQETGKHIMLLPENLQQLLGKKFPVIEQKKLRAFLQTSHAILIIGSATTVFNALHDHSHPFFHFFHVRRLKDLSFEGMKTLTLHILSERPQAEFKEKVTGGDARLKALYSFTGGNPRMAVFLADILCTEVPGEMLEIMDRILDELTPYFLSIVEGIPDYLEEILNTLAAFEPAQSPGEIAEHLEIPQPSIRNYLKLLKEDGYVRVAFSRGKSNYYCLNEYLYRVWFQMRDSSHREETRWLMEFLLIIYSREDINTGKKTFSYEKPLGQTASFIENAPDYGNSINRDTSRNKIKKHPGKGEFVKDPGGEESFRERNDKESIIFGHINSIYNGSESLPWNPPLREIGKNMMPLVKTLNAGDYIKEFYLSKNERTFSEIRLSILLILLAKYDVVGEHIKDIIKLYLGKDGEEKKDFELLIFTIKLSIWLKSIEGNLNEALRLVEFYIEYIKALKESKEKESEMLNFSFDLFSAQVKYNIEAENVKKILVRLKKEDGVPLSDAIFKIWTCLSEPDSVEAQRYLNEKAIAEIVKELKEKAKKNS